MSSRQLAGTHTSISLYEIQYSAYGTSTRYLYLVAYMYMTHMTYEDLVLPVVHTLVYSTWYLYLVCILHLVLYKDLYSEL